MKEIYVKRAYYEPEALYSKATSKSQRALVGYMAKAGYLRDPIYGGAFRLLSEIESNAGIYFLSTKESPKVAMEITNIAEKAMLGRWDSFALSRQELADIVRCFQMESRERRIVR